MPELCRFSGMVVRMFHNDYPPPHFHVEYGEFKAKIEIGSLKIIRGRLPSRQRSQVEDWATARESELLSAWDRAINHMPAGKIEPLS